MNGRAITFILLSSLIMVTAMTLQSLYTPRPLPTAAPDVENPAIVKENDAADAEAEKNEPPTDQSTGQDVTSDPDSTIENVVGNDLETGGPDAEDEFLTIGSLSDDGSDRYLITANRRGGTVRRIELNVRDQKTGRFRYRDLEWTGGYLGQLEPLDTSDGVKVRVVGPGTPAALATSNTSAQDNGVRAGDILKTINQVPVTSVVDFDKMMAATKPGQPVQLFVRRDQRDIQLTATLWDMPIELVRPEPGVVDPDFDFPESFVLSIIKPVPELDKAWPDVDQAMRSQKWDIDPQRTSDRQIVFTWTLTGEQLATVDLAGPVTVEKIFTLPELAADDTFHLDSRTFHWDLTIRIRNDSDQSQLLAFELDGPTGAPTETWWYANKIHGRSTAIGYIAGARDVLGGNAEYPFLFFSGPEIVDGANKTPPKVNYICDPYSDDPEDNQLIFAGVDTQYFNVSLLPDFEGDDAPFECNSLTAFVNGRGAETPDDAKLKKLVDVTFQMVKAVELKPGESYSQSFEIFSGPKEAELLDNYGLGETENFGWFAWCSKPLLWLLHVFYYVTFQFSYGIAIVMLTILVRSCMIPFSRKMAINAQMMQYLQPQIMEIKKKYPDDFQKQSQAQRELFQKHNYKPLGGCFLMFFQLPVFLGLYRGLSVDIALRDMPLIPGMTWCNNLSGPDQFLYWKDWMPAWLGSETGWLGPYLNILPLATMVLFIVQQKVFTPPAADEQQQMMQKMMMFMMVFMGVLFFKVPAGLCIYFITSSIWGIAERLLLPKPVLDTTKLATAGGPSAEITPAPAKPARNARLEAKAEADREERKRQNLERKKRLRDRGKK